MDKAAFQGTYSDIKLIRSRKVAVVCVEIPIEAATAFVAAFGMPDPAEEKWIALALMKDVSRETSNGKRKFNELPPAQQAALACKREAFQRFVSEAGDYVMGPVNEMLAAVYVRYYCDIESRSELNTNEEAAAKWVKLYHNFTFWLAEEEQ